MKPHPLILRDEVMRARVLRLVMSLDLKKPWRVTVEPYRRSRSLEQNNLYHKWVGIIAAETGNSHDAVHEWCKHEFLAAAFVDMGGKVREIRRSTTTLKVDEMSAYMNAVYAWATSDLGLLLPIPEDLGRAA